MSIGNIFVKEGIHESQIEEYMKEKFNRAGYSHTTIQRTSLGTRIIIFVNKPGIVIGKSGRKINELSNELKNKFQIDNPLIDVKEIEEPFLDANIVANKIAKSLEKGINFKKVCNFILSEVMKAGAIGISIRVAGKLAGSERSRFQKFQKGFIAHSGDYAEKLVDKGYIRASMKPGVVGVTVRIMKNSPNEVIMKNKTIKEVTEIDKMKEN